MTASPPVLVTLRRQGQSGRRGWVRHPASLAAVGYLLIRAVGVLALTWSPARDGRPLVQVLGIWDGGWYVRIAEAGYADHLDLSSPLTDQSTGSLAFFPGYPMLIRMVSGLTGLDSQWVGVGISLVAGAVAAAGIAVLASDWAGLRVGVLAALLWAAAPMAVVGSMVYTEALFTALAVWAFVALRRHSWLLAGVLGGAAGLTRPTGIAVGITVAAYAGWTWWRNTHPDSAPADGEPGSARSGALVLVAAGLALAGTPTFWLWVATRAGRWDGWFAVQDAFWGSRFDGGTSLLTLAGNVITGKAPPGVEMLSAAAVLCLLAAVGLLGLAVRSQVWWPLVLYAAVSLVMVIGSAGYVSSKLRFLVPIFVLAFPLARWLAGRSRAMQVLAVLSAVVATTVIGTWLLQSWPYAI
ncbi:MAG: glycosyltransferase family 39 protein [Actinomycetota bacterium]|nr:glycosyltransferase family 39 protein [Actinomycetota bacterium]